MLRDSSKSIEQRYRDFLTFTEKRFSQRGLEGFQAGWIASISSRTTYASELQRVWIVEEQSIDGDSTVISVHTTEEGAMNHRWREKDGMAIDKPWVEDYYVYSMILRKD